MKTARSRYRGHRFPPEIISLSTTWGDQMTSVLGNAVLAFLESERGGRLVDRPDIHWPQLVEQKKWIEI